MSSYPWTIIGGGLVGTVTALALAQITSDSILLLDGKPPPSKNSSNALDTRTLALNYASKNYLDALGLWSLLENYACPIQHIHISEQGAFGHCTLHAEDIDYEALGYVIEIQTLYETCLQALTRYPNITHLTYTHVEHLNPYPQGWEIFYTHEQKKHHLQTQMLFLADGTHSTLRTQCGIQSHTYDYEQDAIVAVARTTLPHEFTAYERFANEYTLAILPLTDNRVGTVLTVPHATLDSFLAMPTPTYHQFLQSLLELRLGKFTKLGSRQHYPLKQVIANTFTRDHLILLGNTAHTLNPLGAQGFNLGLAGIKDAIQAINCHESLDQFAKRQQKRCKQLEKFTRQADQLFHSPSELTRCARRTALFALEHVPTLKKRFTRRMMGIHSI